MADLGGFIEGFLTADGFEIINRGQNWIAAERGDGAASERRRIWIADPDNGIALDEAVLMAAFKAEPLGESDHDQAYLVVPTLAGLSTGFRQAASDLGVRIRVPIQFFDTPYKSDGDQAFGRGRSRTAISAFAEFIEENKSAVAQRVEQPFVALSSLGEEAGGFATGPDLLPVLVKDLSAPPGDASVAIIIGNAGAGKSVLFAALFDALSRHFAEEKKGQRPASRPILFLPAHIREETSGSLDGLLTAVAQTDAASPTAPPLMRWLHENGLSIWMFDGLDEFFAGEADFLAALERGLTSGGLARTVICTRDSLLTSSTALRSFVERHMATGRVRIYELARWERASQRALAWRRFEQQPAKPGEGDTPRVAAFLERLEASPALAELATLPYYCNLLLEQHGAAKGDAADELALLATAVDSLIDREAEKLASGDIGFDWDVFSGADAFVDAADVVTLIGAETFNSAEVRAKLVEVLRSIGRERLVELIEGIAHRTRMLEPYPNEGRGIPIGELQQLSQFYLDVGLVPQLEPRVVLAVVQLAFFGPGRAKGHVTFAHEIIADFLAARHAFAIIKARPESADALGQALGVRRDLDRTIVLRYLTVAIGGDPALTEAVMAQVQGGRVRAQHAENAASLARSLAERFR